MTQLSRMVSQLWHPKLDLYPPILCGLLGIFGNFGGETNETREPVGKNFLSRQTRSFGRFLSSKNLEKNISETDFFPHRL